MHHKEGAARNLCGGSVVDGNGHCATLNMDRIAAAIGMHQDMEDIFRFVPQLWYRTKIYVDDIRSSTFEVVEQVNGGRGGRGGGGGATIEELQLKFLLTDGG